MKKRSTLLACSMMVFCMSAFAQTSDTMGRNNSNKMKSDKMMGKTMSAVGCIAEKDGKYMLMNKQHPDGMMLMGSEDMKPHVGHKVKLTGMMEKDSMMKGDMNSNDSMGMMAMKVTSMKMMSDHCDMDGMMKK